MPKTFISVIFLLFEIIFVYGVNQDELHANYWKKLAKTDIDDRLKRELNENVAKNVIFFLGDGMGMTTITAGRILKGQMNKKSGEEEKLVFENFPYVSLAKTYAVDRQTPDSANTATAYLCGVKANYGTLGVTASVSPKNCDASKLEDNRLTSVLQWAQKSGKATGFVTTTRVTHATPAGLYAKSAERDWEGSLNTTLAGVDCPDIAHQLVHEEPGKNINLIFGGGRRSLVDYSDSKVLSWRNDNRNLLEEYAADKRNRGLSFSILHTINDLNNTNFEKKDFLLGIFADNHISYEHQRDKSVQPGLVDMAKKAVEFLQSKPDGYFLLVEGGRIDHGHHDGAARKALSETVEFDKAIETVYNMVDLKDTLLVVTADHSHVFNVGGYPLRGNSIFGFADVSDVDYLKYTTLSYGNGPGYVLSNNRKNLTEEETSKDDYLQETAVPLIEETHGAEDVPVFATGPMAHLFSGVHEQSYIPHAIAYAACIGDYTDNERCNNAALNGPYPALLAIAVLLRMYLMA